MSRTTAKRELISDIVQEYRHAARNLEKIKVQLDALGVDIADDAFSTAHIKIADHPDHPGRTLVTAAVRQLNNLYGGEQRVNTLGNAPQ